MKSFFKFIINFFMNIIIIILLLILFYILYSMLFEDGNTIVLEDTVTYLKSFGEEQLPTNFSYIDKSSVNLSVEDYTKDETNITNNIKKRYYYNQLNDTSKIIYASLEKNKDNLKKDNYIIDYSTQFNTLLNQVNGKEKLNRSFQTALDAFFYDYPELFYIDITKISLLIKYTKIGNKTTYHVSLSPENNKNYLYDVYGSETKVNELISKVENAKNNILKYVPKENNYKRALKVHDILVSCLEYDSSNPINSHNLYGALIDQKVVCEGYAKAFKYILDSLNIECILVSGTATNSSGETEAHMWNYINLNNTWYGVDVTWDDPIIIGGFTKDIIRHNYFCKGKSVFNNSHKPNNQISDEGYYFSIPTLSSTDYK